jgi:uncharacterized protein YegL
MRRLPIYFLIDISESMVIPIQQVEEATIIQALKTDPHARNCFCVLLLCLLQTKTLVPLQEIVSILPNFLLVVELVKQRFRHLMHELRTNIVKTTYEIKEIGNQLYFIY